MKNGEILLALLFSIASVCSLIIPASAAVPLPDGSSIDHPLTPPNMQQVNVRPMIATGKYHLVGLKSDGTLVAVGDNSFGQSSVGFFGYGGPTGVVQIAAGLRNTVGLKCDGTVTATGSNSHGQCDLDGWTDIIQVAAGDEHIVGLKFDGTVVVKGTCSKGQCDVRRWTDIVEVVAGDLHTVGLKSDSTVVAVGWNQFGQCDVGNWTDITQVAAGLYHTVGLKSDGSVIAVGESTDGQCDIGDWTAITQLAADKSRTLGLKNDGTVLMAGADLNGSKFLTWTDIVQVATYHFDIVGLKSDGTVVGALSAFGVDKWNLGTIAQHTLTISSTVGGAVITPGEQSFDYTAGVMIHLVAEPHAGYRFVNWTGDVDAIFNGNAATTMVTMSDSHSITANFEKIPPTNWPLIGGIIAAVLIAVFFFRTRRAS